MESPSSFVRPTSEVLPAPLPVGRAATYGGHVIEDGEGFVNETLAVRLRSGDPEALSEAYRHHSRLVYSLALRGLGVPHDAEDATQQVFVSAWRGRHGLDPNRGSLAGWLVGITRNVVADMHAQRARTTRNLLAVGSRVEPPDPPLDAAVVAQVDETTGAGSPCSPDLGPGLVPRTPREPTAPVRRSIRSSPRTAGLAARDLLGRRRS